MAKHQGFDRGLANFGGRDFARYLRRAFTRSFGFSDRMIDSPIVGIVASQLVNNVRNDAANWSCRSNQDLLRVGPTGVAAGLAGDLDVGGVGRSDQ